MLGNLSKTPSLDSMGQESPSFLRSDYYRLSTPLASLLNTILTYRPSSASQLPSQQLSQLCQLELDKIANIKMSTSEAKDSLLDNQLTLSVLSLQAHLLMKGENKLNSKANRYRMEHQSCYEMKNSHDVTRFDSYQAKNIGEKVIQLSRVCQKLPQLQAFNQTLSLSQLQSTHKVSFLRVTKVLLNLHQRVTYLSKQKPQLLKQLQTSSDHLKFVNQRIDLFLTDLNQQSDQLSPISFIGYEKQLPSPFNQPFTKLQQHLSILSEGIINREMIAGQQYQKSERIITIIDTYRQAYGGNAEAIQEWIQLVTDLYRDEGNEYLYEEETKLLIMLDQCLSTKDATDRIRVQPNQQDKQLQIQVNKLIDDYERLKQQNAELMNSMEIEKRLKRQLLIQVDERNEMIIELKSKKQTLKGRLTSRLKEEQCKILENQAVNQKMASEALQQKLKDIEKQNKQLKTELNAKESEWSTNKIKIKQEQLKIRKQYEEQIQKLKAKIQSLISQNIFFESKVSIVEKNNNLLHEQLKSAEKKVDEYNHIIVMHYKERKNDYKTTDDSKTIEKITHANKELQKQNQSLKEQIDVLKFQLTQSEMYKQNSPRVDSQNISLQLSQVEEKNKELIKAYKEVKVKAKQVEARLEQADNKIKGMKMQIQDLEEENYTLKTNISQGDRAQTDLMNQLTQLRKKHTKQIISLKQSLNSKELELSQKDSSIKHFKVKIKVLQENLSRKTQVSSTKETIYQSYQQSNVAENSRIMEIKLQQQNRSIKSQLQEKIQNELKLKGENQQLRKEIDHLKKIEQNLKKELALQTEQLTQQRDKNDFQNKKLRQYEIKQKLRSTRNIPERDYDLPSSSQTLGQKSYPQQSTKRLEMLSKEHKQFQISANQKIQNLNSLFKSAADRNKLLQDQIRTLRNRKDCFRAKSDIREESKQFILAKRIRILQNQVKELEEVNKKLKKQ